jgi:Domain of unknown function (DUF4167)
MRNGQNKRMRGRNNNRRGQNPLTRVYESNGPDVKIRGTASHVADKYMQLARDAQSSGDPVAAENYYQHAEHYFRMIAAAQEQFRQNNPYYRDNEPREASFDDSEDDGSEQQPGMVAGDGGFGQREQPQQPYPPREPQPYMPRDQRHFGGRDRPQPYGGRPQQQGGGNEEAAGDADRLPAFVTGSAPQPGQSQPGGYGQNGFDGGSPDRFPLHRRRRRRHGGPRPEGQGPSGEPGDIPPNRPGGE